MEIFSGFLIGIIGSLHCVGMCGPLVLALPLTKADRFMIAIKSLSYNIGRVLTYGIIGGVMGLLGWCLEIGGLQNVFSIILGTLLLYSSLTYLFPSINLSRKLPNIGLVNKLSAKLKKALIISSNSSAIKIGMLNGLLPCGLVYVALASSVTMTTPLYSSIFMIFFGLGTIPLMFMVMFLGHEFKSFSRKLRRYLPLALALGGLYLIYRGLAIHLAENPNDIVNGIANMGCH